MDRSLSNVPMVGCRNSTSALEAESSESIKRSDGGVSEQDGVCRYWRIGVYQTFRWWGVGT